MPIPLVPGGGSTSPPTTLLHPTGGTTSGGVATGAPYEGDYWILTGSSEVSSGQLVSYLMRERFSVMPGTASTSAPAYASPSGSVQSGKRLRMCWWLDIAVVQHPYGDFVADELTAAQQEYHFERAVEAAKQYVAPFPATSPSFVGRTVNLGDGQSSEAWYLSQSISSFAGSPNPTWASLFERRPYIYFGPSFNVQGDRVWHLKSEYTPTVLIDHTWINTADPTTYAVWLCDQGGTHLGTLFNDALGWSPGEAYEPDWLGGNPYPPPTGPNGPLVYPAQHYVFTYCPLSVTVHGTGGGGTTGPLVLLVNGEVSAVTVERGATVSLSIDTVDAQPEPHSGTLMFGDGSSEDWSSQDDLCFVEHIYSSNGTYYAQATEALTYDGAPPMMVSNSVVVTVVAPGTPVTDAPPAVSWVSPTHGGTVSRTTSLTAQATDDVGVVRVRFYADGGLVGEATSPAPGTNLYSVSWETRDNTNGQFTLTAIAYDTAGQATSASITVSVANELADETRIFWTGAQLSGDEIRSFTPVVTMLPPDMPENTYRLDVTANLPGTAQPTVANLGTTYARIPTRKTIRPTASESGAALAAHQTSVAVALYLTPMLSILEHHTEGTIVEAMCSVRGGQGTLSITTPTQGQVESLGDGTIYVLTSGPNLLYRMSAAGALELVYDFGRSLKIAANAAGERPSSFFYDYSHHGSAYGYITGGAPVFGVLEEPEDWVVADMAPLGTKLLIAMNAADGSRGCVLVFDTAGLPANSVDLEETYYLRADNMPYLITLHPFPVLSVNCVESERASASNRSTATTLLKGAPPPEGQPLTPGSTATSSVTNVEVGEEMAWFGCSTVTGGCLLSWDGSKLAVVTDDIEEVTCLYYDERTASSSDAYAETLWIGTQGAHVYRYPTGGSTVTEEMNTGDFAVTSIRRFIIAPNMDVDTFQGDGFLYASTSQGGKVYRRNHSATVASAWAEVHDYADPPYPVASGLWSAKFFEGSLFYGGDGQMLCRRNSRGWTRAYEFNPYDVDGITSFVSNSYSRMLVGTRDHGTVFELALADAEVATQGVTGIGVMVGERAE